MPTTSNFGWSTPADTDLVKDGAAAIRTLGNSIDTSMAELKGGTTGQVLSKTSNTDMDFTWVAQDDSNAIQNALLTTTGDTIYASGASTPARLGIGTTGQVLTVAGGVPSWATPASGVPANAVATVATEQGTTSATYTDLATSGPAVTVTTGTKALVIISSEMGNGTSNNHARMSYAVSGATTISASDSVGLMVSNDPSNVNGYFAMSRASSITLTAGSNTFTAKYRRVTGGTATFINREIFVINLA